MIIECVIFPEQLDVFVLKLKKEKFPIKYVVLLTDEATLKERDNNWEVNQRVGERATLSIEEFKRKEIESRHILETSELLEEELVRIILKEDRFLL